MTTEHLSHLRSLAIAATHAGAEKWNANTELISWFRSDPEAVIEALQAADAIRRSPGGISNTRLYKALDRLPKVPA